jgi:pimeloyl-ACP methyl ester carboxylesterase
MEDFICNQHPKKMIKQILVALSAIAACIVAFLYYVLSEKNKPIDWKTFQDLSNTTVRHNIFVLDSGRKFEYFELGASFNETKDSVLLLHGTAMTGNFFTMYADFFKEHNIHAVTFTTPGHGYSDPYPTHPTVKKFFESDILPLINKVIPERDFSVVGFSYAGGIASYMGSHIDRVKNVGLFNSMAPVVPYDATETELNAALNFSRTLIASPRSARLFGFTTRVLINYLVNKLFTPNELTTAERINKFRRELFSKDMVRGVMHGSDGLLFAVNMMGSEWDADFDKLSDKNVLITSGKMDDRAPMVMQKYLQKKIKNSRYEVFDDAHPDIADHFDRFVLMLLNK